MVCTAGLIACDASRAPSAPSGGAPIAPALSSTNAGELIRGTVSDTALRPIAGARVELLDGPQAGASTMTNLNGEFSLQGTVDDATKFRATMAGHLGADVNVQPVCDRCNPKRWVHFYLNRLEPAAALAGDYTLTFTAGSACTKLPDGLRTRSYEVTVAPGSLGWIGSTAKDPTAFTVSPKGSRFPQGLNNFSLHVAGNYVALLLGDHTDPGITEQVAEHTYWAFGGWATVTVESPVSTISTRFQGWIDSCVNPGMGTRYDCTPSPTVTLDRCDAVNHELTLTRR